jgi:hypothetical protein
MMAAAAAGLGSLASAQYSGKVKPGLQQGAKKPVKLPKVRRKK